MNDCTSWVSFDPGKTTGMTLWIKLENEEPQCKRIDQFNQEQLDQFLEELSIYPLLKNLVFIIEEYIIFGQKRHMHVGKKIGTIEVIGQLKAFARKYKIEIVEQPARILTIAQLWSGCKIPSDHSISHWASAYNHAYYYLHKKGLIKARVLENE